MPSRTLIEPAAPPATRPGTAAAGDALRHVAIIMDGNRRWARSRGMPPVFGHQRGAEAVRRTVEGCRDRDIRYLTLFAFSSENWRRPASEVNELMNLLRFYLRREINELARSGVRLRFLGEREVMAGDIARDDGRGRAAHPAQRRADADHRAELRQPPRDRPRRARDRRARRGRRARLRGDRRGAVRPAPSTRSACPTPTC